MCNFPSLEYKVSSYDTPICIGVDGGTAGKAGDDRCYNDPAALVCIYDYIAEVNADQMFLQETYGDTHPKTYFSGSPIILIVAIMNCVYLLSSDFSKRQRDSGSLTMYVLSFLLLDALMLLSAGYFTEMQNVSCPVGSPDAAATCLEVSECNMGVKSILTLHNKVVTAYSGIVIFLMIAHFLMCVYTYVMSKKLQSLVVPYYDGVNESLDEMTMYIRGDSGVRDVSNSVPEGESPDYRYDVSRDQVGRELQAGYVSSRMKMQQLVKKWKYFDCTNGEMPAELQAVSCQGHSPDCAICLCAVCPTLGDDNFTKGAGMIVTVVQVPCQHWFHRECLLSWVATKQRGNDASGDRTSTCPVCRANLSNGQPTSDPE